ncbi:hypothetical protein LG003_22550 [Photorhabdus kleinii]|uniref:hypothetical protein n=1 Tax=Photorhabdus kleinii TaxID=768034 RepID=UPI0021D48C0C|nr:hypothetical protein [Photorhabdus kleinii]MCT8345532.1 hypothetical protein [Photorhabdus kleinii]
MKLIHWIAEFRDEFYKKGLVYNTQTLALYGSRRELKDLLEGKKHIKEIKDFTG